MKLSQTICHEYLTQSIRVVGLGAERPAEAKAGKGVTVTVMERAKKK